MSSILDLNKFNFERISFNSSNQPSYSPLNPVFIDMTFDRIVATSNPRVIKLTSQSSSFTIYDVRSVDIQDGIIDGLVDITITCGQQLLGSESTLYFSAKKFR